ncbi:MAG: ATP-binding protein [Gemmatimonadota bacterium]
MRTSLNRVILLAIAGIVAVALVPAAVVLDRRLARALEERSRSDLATAPGILSDRNAGYSDAMMMHAKELSLAPGLAQAVKNGDRSLIAATLEALRPTLGGGVPVVVDQRDSALAGPLPEKELIDATRAGQMPVTLSAEGRSIHNVALAPLKIEGQWVGAAGVASPVDARLAEAYSGLTRSHVVIVVNESGSPSVSAATVDSALAIRLLAAYRTATADSGVRDLDVDGGRYQVVSASLGRAGSALFVRDVRQELAVLPDLRRTAVLAAAAAVAIALLAGWWVSMRLSRPVRDLAAAADALRLGSFDAPLPNSGIEEVARVSERFDEMRQSLAARLNELRVANDMLQDRNERLTALQADLMQRERLAAAGRLVAQLAHEIRNPVASLRNCLEIIRRRLVHDKEALEFADLAIDELLRMHELAEQMLDVGRPRDPATARCYPARVAADVARLVTAGVPAATMKVDLDCQDGAEVPMASDALKQVLLNLAHNAREAQRPGSATQLRIATTATSARVLIHVDDNGPGVHADLRERIFDPFFSSKSDVHGVGLGLFVAEGLVRGAGGRLTVADSPAVGGGARFTIELPNSALRGGAEPATSTSRAAAER